MIIKLTSSGKAVLVTDDFGNSYVTSKDWLIKYLLGTEKKKFVMLTRLPQPVSLERFPSSPLFGSGSEHIPVDDPRWFAPQCSHSADGVVGMEDDGLGRRSLRESKEQEAVKDKVVW